MSCKLKSILLGACCAVIAAPVWAGSLEPIDTTPVSAPPATPAAAPDNRFASLFGAPNAVAPSQGFASAALTWATPRGGIEGRDADGDLSLSYTLGNPVTGISVTAGVTASGLDPFGDAGSFSLEFSRLLTSGATSATFAGLSAGSLGAWGDGAADPAYTGYVTQVGVVGASETPYIWTLGYGTDNTLSTDGRGTLSDGFVWGAGIGVIPNVSLSVSGTETQVNTGATISIPGLSGWSAQIGVLDVTENVSRRQTAVTIGYGIDTRGIFK